METESLRVEFGVLLEETPAEHRVAVLGALLIRLGSRFNLMDRTQLKAVQESTGKPFADLTPLLLLELDVYWFLLYLHTHICKCVFVCIHKMSHIFLSKPRYDLGSSIWVKIFYE